MENMKRMIWLLVGLVAFAAFARGEEIPVDRNGRIAENLLLVRASASDKWKRFVPVQTGDCD